MRALFLVILLVLCCTCRRSSAVEHECIHDTEAMQARVQQAAHRIVHVARRSDHVASPQRLFHAQATATPIRIVVSALDLDNSSKYCTAEGQTVSDFVGGTITCSKYDVFNSTARDILMYKLLPRAIAKLQTILSVDAVVGNLRAPSTSSCGEFTIPATHVTDGVPNADYVLYVSVAPTVGANVAWAGACASDAAGRPVIGAANFAPRFLYWTTEKNFTDLLSIGMHELFHALGFTSSRFNSSFTASTTRRGKTVNMVTLPTVRDVTRSYFGCPTIEGAELEDEGAFGTVGSHWDRRIIQGDIMGPTGGPLISDFTLGVFKDLGYYTVNSSAAEPLMWGKNAGCSWFTEKCNTPGGGRDRYWCFSYGDSCTADYQKIGYCAMSNLMYDRPSFFQYFANPRQGGDLYVDACPVVKPYVNRYCNVYAEPIPQGGFYFGPQGRCFNTSGLAQEGFLVSTSHRCLQADCPGGARVRFRSANNSAWTDCPLDGSAGVVAAPPGYTGTISCPAAAHFCAPDINSVIPTALTSTVAPTTTTGFASNAAATIEIVDKPTAPGAFGSLTRVASAVAPSFSPHLAILLSVAVALLNSGDVVWRIHSSR